MFILKVFLNRRAPRGAAVGARERLKKTFLTMGSRQRATPSDFCSDCLRSFCFLRIEVILTPAALSL
tara:strand:- start:894 stop:1094 length:201 start_codon:yes stop_codon:yes gene_type:complete